MSNQKEHEEALSNCSISHAVTLAASSVVTAAGYYALATGVGVSGKYQMEQGGKRKHEGDTK